MIPKMIDAYLREHGLRYQLHEHGRTIPAQRLAATEHVPGGLVAKVVVVSVDGHLALGVVAANHHLDVAAMRAALGAREIHLAPERAFVERFWPCEAGAEPPLSMFGVPIYVDAQLARQPWLLMRAGTHEDAMRIDTDDWLLSERARVIAGLGRLAH